MSTPILSGDEVRRRMAGLSLSALEELAKRSKVPFTTLYKIKRGETMNPGIETVRAFIDHIPVAASVAADGNAEA